MISTDLNDEQSFTGFVQMQYLDQNFWKKHVIWLIY